MKRRWGLLGEHRGGDRGRLAALERAESLLFGQRGVVEGAPRRRRIRCIGRGEGEDGINSIVLTGTCDGGRQRERYGGE